MRQRKKKRLPKRQKRLIILSISGIILAGILLFGAGFYTQNVQVVGNKHYTESEVKSMVMQGPISWNTLLMSTFREHISFENTAFMEYVDVEYLNHNTIRLHVSEKYPIGYVEWQGQYYYFDKSGMVLDCEKKTEEEQPGTEDSTDNSSSSQSALVPDTLKEEASKPFQPDLDEVPLITGLTFDTASVGTKLEVPDDSIFNSILGLTRMFEKYQIVPDSVEIGENYELTLHYGNVRAALGKDENLEDKMTRVAGILPKLAGESGILHLEEFTYGTQNIIFDKDQM